MKRRFATSTVALTIALIAACAPVERAAEAPLSDADARAIIDAMMAGWDEAVEAGEPGANVSMYTTDGIRMQPDMPALVGLEAIDDWMRSEAEAYTFEGSNKILEVRALGRDWILFRSEGSFVRTPKAGGDPFVEHEKWLSIAQRQDDGTWRLYRDAGSSVVPR